MIKYLAVVQDSFREALASRVLWLVLVVITLFLLAIAPLGYRETVTWKLGDADINTWFDFLERLRQEGPQDKESPSRHIWRLLDDDLKQRLATAKIPGKDQDLINPIEVIGTMSRFQKAMNALLERDDFYREDSWKGAQILSRELQELRKQKPEQLSQQERARLNRLWLEAAYPNLVRSSPPTSIQLRYAWHDLGPQQPLRGTTLQESIQSATAWVMKWFLGAIGVFTAILVTAPIIPQMFDPGALHLLLSKPVARWLLFLSKFAGGCSFILIGATYLVGGVWLVLGTRFGVWDTALLLSIPIYLFVFAIYYSVSALAGVIWRSPIVCVALTVLFFAACWLIGTSKVAFERAYWDKLRIAQVLQAKDTLFTVNEMGLTSRWDEKRREWHEVFVADAQKQSRAIMMFMPVIPREFRPLGPVYDTAHDRLVSAQPSFPPGRFQLCLGTRAKDWASEPGVAVPGGAFALLAEPDGKLLAVSNTDLQRLSGDPLRKVEPIRVFGMTLPAWGGSAFRSVGPDPPLVITQPAAAALHASGQELAVFTRGTLLLLKRDAAGHYQRHREAALADAERQPVVLGFAGRTVLLGREDGRIQVFAADTLQQVHELRLEDRNPPRLIVPSPDGRQCAVVLHTKNLWLYDSAQQTAHKAPLSGQGTITAAAFTADGQLLVAEEGMSVSRYQLPTLRRVQHYAPRLGLLIESYRYGLLPLYTVFPKPGELGTTFEYLLSKKETRNTVGADLTAAQQTIDPWTPLSSSAAFTLLLLAASCIYVEWQDF